MVADFNTLCGRGIPGSSFTSRYDRAGGLGEGWMRSLALLAAALAALALGGCATDVGPSPSELKAQWDAQNISPTNYQQDLLAFLRTYLNDPSHIRGAAVTTPQLRYVGPGQRYVACVRYNARNSEGKYLGSKDGAAVYVSGKLD